MRALAIFLICFAFQQLFAAGRTARELIGEVPERSGGIYYAYPCSADEMPAPPEGYKAAFVSHYGRHGSRWLIKMWEYDEPVAVLEKAMSRSGLTPLGIDVLNRLKIIASQARGNKGALSPKGERQHRDIAARMAARFPGLFADSARIEAYSSVEPRCIMSMAAFCERLKELNPSLRIQRHASPGDMDFISWSNEAIKAVNEPSAPWWKELESYRDSLLRPERLVKSLVNNEADIDSAKRFMWVLHDVAVGVQDTDPGVGLLDLFTADELYSLWLPLNYKMYYLHGNNPATAAAGPASARSLLDNIVADVDSAAAGSRRDRAVTLRFGHDSALMRLLALMQIDGASAAIDNPRDYAGHWIDFTLTPMAANLQLTLFKSDKGDEPLVLIRLNERPVTLPLKSTAAPFYRWSDVKALWENK